MTVHYRDLAVPVDPEFARELKAQLDARRVRQHGSLNPSPAADQPVPFSGITEVTLALTPDKQPDHRWRRVGLAAAVVAVLAAGIVLVLATADDDAERRPADRPRSATSDRRFAGAVALTPHDWGANYTFGRWANGFRMSRELAETLPECAPFLDTVFESPGRPATVTTATAATGTRLPPLHWQYVVVFPDVAGAEAMMDAVHDPRYPDCDARYRSELSGGDPAPSGGVPPRLDLAGDDSVVVNTTPYVRAGRTVMTFDSVRYHWPDDEADARAVERVVARAVERVEAAEAGTPLPSVALPLEYLTKSVFWSRISELEAGWAGSDAPEWTLDRSLALSVPSCAAFVDGFFRRPIPTWQDDEYDASKSLAYTEETLQTDPQADDAPGGVFRRIAIAYKRQQDAEDAMDAISDSGFPRCLADYTSAQPPNEAWQATTREPISASALSSPLGDENVQMLFEGRYIGPDGTTGPVRRIVDVFIRVDQVLIGVEVTLDHMSTDVLESVLQQMVDRAEAATAGAPIPSS
jgi:hypothetical protein